MTAVDRSIPFIDTHHHLWELSRFPYDWLRPPGLDSITALVGDYSLLQADWAPRRLFREFYGQNVIKSVHVEADSNAPDPVDETVWLEEVANEFGMPNGIVVFTDLERDGADAELDRHLAASPRVRGVRIRQLPDDPAGAVFRRNYRALLPRRLSFDLNASPGKLLAGRDLAAANPEIQVILCHAGLPIRRDPDYLQLWRHEISELATIENVACKVSALGMGDHQWTLESVRPLVLHCLDAFGLDRVVFATNWPVDLLFAPYLEQADAWRTIIAEAGLRRDEQEKLLYRNAERLYRI